MTQPLVDIIILSMNRADDTIAAIASALEQDGVPTRVWVLDQGSDAENLTKLEQFCEGKRVHLEKGKVNLGVPGGRNKVTSLGSAPYIVALDNDAIFADRLTVKRAADYLAAHPELGVIGFQILNFTTGEIDEYSWGYPKALRPRWNEEFDTAKFIGAGHAIVREHFERVGAYDAELFFAFEELDFCYRLINSGLRIRYVPSIKVLHKVSPELRVSWTGGRYYFLVRNRLYIFGKFGASAPYIALFAAGYFIKGIKNGVALQAVRAIRDAAGMLRRFRARSKDDPIYQLSPSAKAYIAHNETRYRGSFWQRIQKELLAKLPSQNITPVATADGKQRRRALKG